MIFKTSRQKNQKTQKYKEYQPEYNKEYELTKGNKITRNIRKLKKEKLIKNGKRNYF